MRSFAKFLLVLSPIAVFAAAPTAAHAASCASLQAELARATSGGGGAVAALERQAQANGCRGATRFGRPRVCAGIDAQIQRARGGGGGDSRRARQLRSQIARQCSGQREARAPSRRERRAQQVRAPAGDVIIRTRRQEEPTRRGGGFFSNLFGGGGGGREARQGGVERVVPESVYREERRRERHRQQQEARPTERRGSETARQADPEAAAARAAMSHWRPNAPKGSNFKTWCVRLCDGFYFPVSENASSNDFAQDLAMCVNQCPAADVSLYAHKTDRAPERMVSAVTGEPYVDLPTAFAYRQTFNGGCGCGTPRTPAEVLEANNGTDSEDGRDGPVELAGFSASTVERLPRAVARIKAKLEPSSGGSSATSPANAYRNPADGDLADDAVAAAAAQASSDREAMAAVARESGLSGDAIRESSLAVRSEAGEPMQLVAPLSDPADAGVSLAPPPTDIGESLRFREVGPKFYAAPAMAEVAPSRDLAHAQ